MAVILVPDIGARAGWMRSSLMVAALAAAGEEGAEAAVPGATLSEDDLKAAPWVVQGASGP